MNIFATAPNGIRDWPLLATPPRYMQAATNSWRWRNRTDVRHIIVHTTECRETPGAATGVGRYFGLPHPVGASHLIVDAAQVVEAVHSEHEAFGAKGGTANFYGYHIEHVGFASQTMLQWNDAYSRGELELSARAAACVAHFYGISVRKLTTLQLAAGESGFASHLDCTRAWHVIGGHTDPGVGFPWDAYLARVQELVKGLQGAA